jgi:hypothetical protein
MPTGSEPTTTAPLSPAPGLISFPLSPSDTNTRAAGVSPAYAEATAGRQNGTRLGAVRPPPALRKQFPQPNPWAPQNNIFSQPWKKSMSELTQGTEKNFGAALLIAL